MEITFYNRQYRIAYLYYETGNRIIPGGLLECCFLSPEECLVTFVPVKAGEEERNAVNEDWMDFLRSFDPDFITYEADMDDSVPRTLCSNFPSFRIIGIDEFSGIIPAIIPGEIDSCKIEREENLKIPLNLLPPVEELSVPLTGRNSVTHIYVDGLPADGKIFLPGNIDKNRIFDILIRDRSGEKKGLHLPANRLFRKYLSHLNPDIDIRPMEFRDTWGFSVLPLSETTGETYIRFPDPANLLPEVFNEAGYSAHPAKTGTFINLFRNLGEAGEFLTKPYAIPLISKMAKTDYRLFNEVRKMISGKSDYDSVETSSEILFMLSRRFLLRGFVLKCSECNHEDFYFMKEVDETFLCRGCRKENTTPLKLNSAYRLNRVVTDGLRDGVIATILTLYRLFCEAEDSFIYCPELGLKSKNAEMEIDIVCIVDGKLVIGEAKMGRLIKDRDFSPRDEFEKYKIISREIDAHRVIFSTIKDSFYEIPMMKIDRFRRELAKEGMGNVEVDIFGGSELLSNHE